MTKLFFQFLNSAAGSIAAAAYFKSSGKFVVESQDQEFADYIAMTVQKIKDINTALPLRGGHQEVSPDGSSTKFVTTEKLVTYGSPDYLDALWDYFNKHIDISSFKGQEFRVYTEEVS